MLEILVLLQLGVIIGYIGIVFYYVPIMYIGMLFKCIKYEKYLDFVFMIDDIWILFIK